MRRLSHSVHWYVIAGFANRVRGQERQRGDVPGWVLVTLMTAGLVVAIWLLAGERLAEVFDNAMDRVLAVP